MGNRIRQFLLMFMVVIMSAFTFVPPVHHIPENNRFIPEVVFELPPISSVTFITSNHIARKGEQICVSISAEGFEKIISMQYTMKWDTGVLRFGEIKQTNLPGLKASNFGSHLIDKGVLTFSWYDPGLKGITRADGTPIYNLCFEVIGEAGNNMQFEFISKPTMIEIANSRGVFLNLRTRGGEVRVK